MNNDLYLLAQKVGDVLLKNKLQLVTAESCTGGMVVAAITDVPGSSAYLERGFVTYSNAAKEEMLGVRHETLQQFGAVSEQTAGEMANGALLQSHAQVSLAITGVAGPAGGTPEKPVGTVCFAWKRVNMQVITQQKEFFGDRASIRLQATIYALEELIRIVVSNEK